MENSMEVPLKLELPYDPVIPFLDIHVNEMKTVFEKIPELPYSLQHYS
jgi:hypothetical protein